MNEWQWYLEMSIARSTELVTESYAEYGSLWAFLIHLYALLFKDTIYFISIVHLPWSTYMTQHALI